MPKQHDGKEKLAIEALILREAMRVGLIDDAFVVAQLVKINTPNMPKNTAALFTAVKNAMEAAANAYDPNQPGLKTKEQKLKTKEQKKERKEQRAVLHNAIHTILAAWEIAQMPKAQQGDEAAKKTTEGRAKKLQLQAMSIRAYNCKFGFDMKPKLDSDKQELRARLMDFKNTFPLPTEVSKKYDSIPLHAETHSKKVLVQRAYLVRLLFDRGLLSESAVLEQTGYENAAALFQAVADTLDDVKQRRTTAWKLEKQGLNIQEPSKGKKEEGYASRGLLNAKLEALINRSKDIIRSSERKEWMNTFDQYTTVAQRFAEQHDISSRPIFKDARKKVIEHFKTVQKELKEIAVLPKSTSPETSSKNALAQKALFVAELLRHGLIDADKFRKATRYQTPQNFYQEIQIHIANVWQERKAKWNQQDQFGHTNPTPPSPKERKNNRSVQNLDADAVVAACEKLVEDKVLLAKIERIVFQHDFGFSGTPFFQSKRRDVLEAFDTFVTKFPQGNSTEDNTYHVCYLSELANSPKQ